MRQLGWVGETLGDGFAAGKGLLFLRQSLWVARAGGAGWNAGSLSPRGDSAGRDGRAGEEEEAAPRGAGVAGDGGCRAARYCGLLPAINTSSLGVIFLCLWNTLFGF